MSIEQQVRFGLRVVCRLEACKNKVSTVLVSDDPKNQDLLLSCGEDTRRITVADMVDAFSRNSVPELIKRALEYVKALTDMWPTEAAL